MKQLTIKENLLEFLDESGIYTLEDNGRILVSDTDAERIPAILDASDYEIEEIEPWTDPDFIRAWSGLSYESKMDLTRIFKENGFTSGKEVVGDYNLYPEHYEYGYDYVSFSTEDVEDLDSYFEYLNRW